MKRFSVSLAALAVAFSTLVVAFFHPEAARPLMLAAGLSTLASLYALPADFVALMIFRMSGSARRRGMAGDLDVGDVTEIKAAIKELGVKHDAAKKAVQDVAKEALDEAKKAGGLSIATKEAADKALAEHGALIQELAQKMDTVGKASAPERRKSIGEQVSSSDSFKALVAGGGFKGAGQAINISVKEITGLTDASGGVLIAPQRQAGVIFAPNRRMTVRDLLMPGRTSTNLIEFFKELLFTNNAAPVSETVTKPESNITFQEAEAKVITIAHWIKATKQIIDDVPAMESFINERLRYGLMLVEEAQLLKGSGVGNNLNGVYTQATAYAAPAGSPTASQPLDTLRLMLLQAELAEYPSTGIVLHPTDLAKIELLKTTEGAYLWSNPTSTNPTRLWGRDVVDTQAMTQDTALVGAFRMGAQIFDREDANVALSTENQDDFIKNRVTIRAEERLALAVYRPQAFVKNANFDGV